MTREEQSKLINDLMDVINRGHKDKVKASVMRNSDVPKDIVSVE